ncbi:MAG: hypothetical protein NBV68_11105 [Erythrobacter sp.]|uniref:hypothetical protein n=1 Tax=Erythrobacter sp. TaxID=1042 RepID=UPI0025E1B7D0|nr:hypothetical protein [Erythrobacter sp.]MCL9999919.1 hypothetical protein [Erythrobacter sp.]
MSRPRALSAIFAWPLAIFVLGIAGLVIALTGDGCRDAAAWAALAAPLIAVVAAMRLRRG